MAATIKEILVDCVQEGLGLPRDPIANDIRDLALRIINNKGRAIFDSWPWDNSKVPEFDAPTPDADGIITFDATVDVVRAIQGVASGSSTGTRIWAQDELHAAARGEKVSTDRFIPLPDDSNGCRRIQLNTDDTGTSTYKALALKRFVEATVEDSYDANDPSATPTDYRYLTFIIDRCEPALRSFVVTSLKKWKQGKSDDDGPELLKVAKDRETEMSDHESRLNPRYPAYSEVGNWY